MTFQLVLPMDVGVKIETEAPVRLLLEITERMDYFDGSIDRITAWVIGTRNMRKALLFALLEPYEKLREAEYNFDFTKRLMMLEELKMLPWQGVWEEYCNRKNVPANLVWKG